MTDPLTTASPMRLALAGRLGVSSPKHQPGSQTAMTPARVSKPAVAAKEFTGQRQAAAQSKFQLAKGSLPGLLGISPPLPVIVIFTCRRLLSSVNNNSQSSSAMSTKLKPLVTPTIEPLDQQSSSPLSLSSLINQHCPIANHQSEQCGTSMPYPQSWHDLEWVRPTMMDMPVYSL